MTDPEQSDAEIQDLPEGIPSASLRRIGQVIAGSFLLLTLYVLSVGPVARLVDAKILPQQVSILYAPLDAPYNNSPVIRKFFDWYMRDVWKR